MTRTSSRAALALVAMLALAACGDDDTTAESTTPAATEAAPATTAGATETTAAAGTTASAGTEAPGTTASGGSAPAAGETTVMTAESEFGTILVDGEGMSLYMFVNDNQGPSVCEGDCLAAWPALAGPATAGEGVDESLLATATRADDGSEQVTYNGWPLYFYGQDSEPGDVNGQGVGDVWYLVDPAGEPIPLP